MILNEFRTRRRLRAAVSAIALFGMNAVAFQTPAYARGDDPVLNACATERAPLVKLDNDYKELKRSKLSQAIGEGLKQGATVIAMGVMNGGLTNHGGGGFPGFGGGAAGLLGAVTNMAAQSAAQQQTGAPTPNPAGMLFGQDVLNGALGLQVPGVSGISYGGGGDNMKAYAALAVLVAIVATADAYAKLKAQEAGGDLKKASYNIDQDAGRQLAVSNEIAQSGEALVDCRSKQLNDINTRLASASNDKDRRAIKRERTDFTKALKSDIDVTGDVVDQHVNMAKTFTQGRAMTDGDSEADVLGGQTPAYADAAATNRLSMPAANGGGNAPAAPVQEVSAPVAAEPLVALKATVVRSAPVASAGVLMNLPAGRQVQPKSAKAQGGWWEIDVAGSPGYVRASDVGPPGSTRVAANGHGHGGEHAAAPPAVAGPSNIRAYNKSVILARDESKGRLNSLMTDIQTSMRRESILYAVLSYVGLG